MAAEVLQSTGKLLLRATGSSMLPTLWPGDLLSFESVPSERIRPGGIVLIEREKAFVIHRVIRSVCVDGRPQFITQGDSMPEQDSPVQASQVLGSLVSARRGSRRLVDFASISPSQKMFGWLLCHCDLLHRLALRWHAARNPEWTNEAHSVAL